jgi:porin-like protein
MAWLSAGVVVGALGVSGAHGDSEPAAAPPAAAAQGPTDGAAADSSKSARVPQALASLAQAPSASPTAVGGSTAAPAAPTPAAPAAAAPGAPEGSEAPAPGSSRGLRIGGTGELLGWANVSGSMRQPIFAFNNSNAQFLLTHVHPNLTATLSPKALVYGEFCITHPRVGPQPELAYAEYDHSDRLSFQVGRFLVPFGQWNQISNVFDHKSIAYPLMYLGHEEEDLVLQGGPRPIFSTGFSDMGLLAYGSVWPRPSDQLWYGAYVCNGRFGGTDIEWEDLWNNYRDNNSNKAFGGRVVWSHGDNLSIGGSYQTGKYDTTGKLGYQFAGGDLYYRPLKKVTLRAEYTQNPVDSFVRGYTKSGWYVSADTPVGKKHEVVLMYSHLRERPAERVENMGRASLGFNTVLNRSLKLKTEVAHLFIGHFSGDPANATDTQFGTSFQDVTSLRASLVAIF